MIKKHWQLASALLLSLAGYLVIGYYLSRENFLQFASLYVLLFGAYVLMAGKGDERNVTILIYAAILLRLVFLFSVPALSNDFYRFIWDGRLLTQGVNPYLYTPDGFIQHSSLKNPPDTINQGDIFRLMNSPGYYSVYPPVCQFVFGFAALIFPDNLMGSIVVLRLACIAAEIGSIFLLSRLLESLNLPRRNLLWYALNPLVIIELSGNLHPEAFMIFFLLLSVFFLLPALRVVRKSENNRSSSMPWKQLILSAVSFACSAAVKILPLMFLPFLIKRLRWKSLFFFLVGAITFFLLFIPFLNQQLIENIASSINLYFRKFEFNASIYYLVRWIGFQVKGYNIIQQSGPWLALAVLLVVMMFMLLEKTLTEKKLFVMMQGSLAIYLLLATTVHPWYITTLVMLSVFTASRFTIVWSLVVIFSYAGYQSEPYSENLWLTAAEYTLVFIAIGLDVGRNWKASTIPINP